MRATILYLTCSAALSLSAFAGESGERFTSVAGISIGNTTLSDIQKKLGPGRIIVTGDASSYDARISYAIRGGTIQFFQGEMNDGVGVCVTTDTRIKPRSPWPENVPMPQVNVAGLQLGISEARFTKIVKQPVRWRGSVATVHFEYRVPITDSERRDKTLQYTKNHDFWSVWMDITGVFYKGRLIKFEIIRTTTDG